MQAISIIEHLENCGTWVNRRKTRDLVLAGNPEIEINKIGVCWMLTNKALQQAISEGVNFIISHENPYYEASTGPYYIYHLSALAKKELMAKYAICAYRCHDVWDKFPDYGIADVWQKIIDLPFEKREISSFNSYASFKVMTVEEIALKIAKALSTYGQDAVQIFGNPKRLVTTLGMGTGAATDVDSILAGKEVEVIVFSEDGCKSYQEIQYCLDNKIEVIRVNHATCEIPGMFSLVDYLKDQFPVDVVYLKEGYDMVSIFAEQQN